MDIERSIEYYESRVWDLKWEDIASHECNAKILQRLRDNDPDFTSITLTDFFDPMRMFLSDLPEEDDKFVVTNNDDMGWLGYLIGRNNQLQDLTISISNSIIDDPNLSPSQIEALTQGISLNRSISMLTVDGGLGYLFLQRLGNFFRSNKSLTHLELTEFDIGLVSALKLALMLRDMSLEYFHVERLCYDSDSHRFIDECAVTAEVITALGKHTKLEHLHLWTCNLDQNSCMALGRLSSLTVLSLGSSAINDEGMQALVCGLSARSHLDQSNVLLPSCCSLQRLELSRMSIDYDKAVALSSGLASLHSLKELSLANSIGDDALQRLVAAMAINNAVEVLDLSENDSITAKGLSFLASLLQSERWCLRELFLRYMRIGDDGTAALTEPLAGNKSLKRLEFHDFGHVEVEIGSTGWSAFTRLLCNTSSINNTYLSNHTLDMCMCNRNPLFGRTPVIVPTDVEYYLALNRDMDHARASMYKILSEHPEFDMKPLLQQWQLKFLPLMVAWFKTARSRRHKMRCDAFTSIDVLQRRELSAIYQFMRGLPSLAVSGYLERKMTGSRSKKRKQTNIDSFFNHVERPLQRRK